MLLAVYSLGQATKSKPEIAYSSGDFVILTSKEGKILRSIRLPVRIAEFSISPDLKSIAFVASHRGEAGGKMYLYWPATNQLKQIPSRPVFASSKEVYSDPQFSRDGSKLLLVAHPQGEGDLFETSGPVVLLDLKSLKATTLSSTRGGRLGPVDTSEPRLSPNGRKILLWGAMTVLDLEGKQLRDLQGVQPQGSFTWSRAVEWIGDTCVLYQAGKGENSYLRGPISLFVLNLNNGKTSGILDVLGLSDEALEGLVSYNYPNAIVKNVKYSTYDVSIQYSLVSQDGTRTALSLDNPALVQLLSGNNDNELPTACE